MSKPNNSKHHMLMLPWVGYGHLTPFLHLSNKLAGRGNRVSFLIPKSALLKLEKLNLHPNLLHFFPLTIPRVDGLPHSAETTSDVPSHLEKHLFTAFDKTQEQVQSYLCNLNPDFVFYDEAYWLPSLVRDKFDGIKCISYGIANTVICAFYLVPSRRMDSAMLTVQELMHSPPGFPSSKIQMNQDEASQALFFYEVEDGLSLSHYERIFQSIKGSDAVALRTCHELEGPFCDYVSEQFAKPVLLTGPALPGTPATQLEEQWANWLRKFEAGSVVFCALGSQIILQKYQFQELLLGLELTGLPFLVALKPPLGCATVEEALPEGFEHRVGERGWVYEGWVPQPLILNHPCTGCFVSHCGGGSMWESLLSDCQVVLIPYLLDQIFGAKLMAEELKVAVEVERGENRGFSKESLCKAIKLVMDKESAAAAELKCNHAKLRNALSSNNMLENYIDTFVQDLRYIQQ